MAHPPQEFERSLLRGRQAGRRHALRRDRFRVLRPFFGHAHLCDVAVETYASIL